MPARHKQIGERAGHEHAMSVFEELATAPCKREKRPREWPLRELDAVPGRMRRHSPFATRPYIGAMHLDLSDDEAAALAQELHTIVERDRYPLSRRIRTLRGILAKLRPEPVREPTGHSTSAGWKAY